MSVRTVPVSSSNSAWMQLGHEVVGRVVRAASRRTRRTRSPRSTASFIGGRRRPRRGARPASRRSRIASWSCSGMPSSMPIVRIGIWAPRSRDEVEPARADERIEAAGAERPDLLLEGVHPLRREHPRHQPAVEVVARRVLHEDVAGRQLDVGLDDLERRALAGPVGVPVLQGRLDVVEPAQGPEVVLLVVVERRLVPHPPPDRVRVLVDLDVERVVVDVATVVGHVTTPPDVVDAIVAGRRPSERSGQEVVGIVQLRTDTDRTP